MPPFLLACLIVAGLAPQATPQWANQVSLPAGVQPTDGTLIEREFDEAVFTIGTVETPKRGKFATGYLTRLPEGFHEPSDAAWKKWEPVLRAKGWMLKGHSGDSYSLQRLDASGESWLTVGLAEYQDPRLTFVRVGTKPRPITLAPPAPKPETVGDAAEWPFLKAAAGSTLENTAVVEEPLDVTAGADREPRLVGRRHLTKQYTPPANFSKLEFELAYADALTRAGWMVLPRRDGVAEGEGVVRAHYAANGRDIWAVLGRGNDDSNTGLGISVADIGADDWSKTLAAACRLPLYGVTFDFNKATIRAESTAVLQKAADALAANPSLRVEVQGHTDDVGDAAYNLALSGQRADAVRAWLAQHGVAAGRMTSKGYGKAQPVVENSSDANRARNRRVELACAK
jgi:OmpA-OmpF porin, OOP family